MTWAARWEDTTIDEVDQAAAVAAGADLDFLSVAGDGSVVLTEMWKIVHPTGWDGLGWTLHGQLLPADTASAPARCERRSPATAAHRAVPPVPIGDVLITLATDRQRWLAPLHHRAGLDAGVPVLMAEVIADVSAFADPVIVGHVPDSASWDPTAGRWAPSH